MQLFRFGALFRRSRRVAPTLWTLLACLYWPPALPAALVEGLYEGRVPVASEDESLRRAAMGQALRQVLTKLTGVAEPRGRRVEAAVAEPEPLMQQFRYRRHDDAAAPFSLWVRFDRAAVDALVRDAGLPEWSAQRPGVLAWVVVERDGVADIVAPEAGIDDAGVARSLAEQAWQQGVPLSFPLLDLEDRVRVQPALVVQQDMEAVEQASQRYSPGALLVGRVQSDAAGAWVASWRFQEGGQAGQWQGRGLTPAGAVTGTFERIARQLASRYAVSAAQAEPGGVLVHVSAVRTLQDYARVLEYLQGLDQVSGLALDGTRGDVISFRMQVRGGPEALRRVASFGGVLAPDTVASGATGVRFRLLP